MTLLDVPSRGCNSSWGSWQDVERLGTHFRLMFDAVINHISQQSAWFQAFQRGESPYAAYFIVVAPDMDLSRVVRPRALPLLTPVATVDGVKQLWTTFSADQIDLNYGNPHVLLEILELLLFYVAQGARLLRLDAIGFLKIRAKISADLEALRNRVAEVEQHIQTLHAEHVATWNENKAKVERALADLNAGLDKANADLEEGREQAKAEFEKTA